MLSDHWTRTRVKLTMRKNFFLIDPIAAAGFQDEFILLVADGKYAVNVMVLTDEVRLNKRVILQNLIHQVIPVRNRLLGIEDVSKPSQSSEITKSSLLSCIDASKYNYIKIRST